MKQPSDNKTVDLEDVFIWPDTFEIYYYRYEVNEELIRFKGDDFRVVPFDTPEWHKIVGNEQ